jgi:aryl-alcohol dehydrogenase-like predicted oxidoreductase
MLSDPDNRLSGFDVLPFDKEHGFRLVERLRKVDGRTVRERCADAIAWLLAKNDVTSVLIRASKHQLDDNLGAANVTLSEGEIAELNAATALSRVYRNWFIERLQDQDTAMALAR